MEFKIFYEIVDLYLYLVDTKVGTSQMIHLDIFNKNLHFFDNASKFWLKTGNFRQKTNF